MSKKIEVLILEDDHLIHHTVSEVYADSNTYNVVIQAMVEAITNSGAVKHMPTQPVSKVLSVKAGVIPLNKPIPQNLIDEPVTQDKRKTAEEEAKQFIARQRKANEESLRNIGQVEREAWKQAAGIKMDEVLNGNS